VSGVQVNDSQEGDTDMKSGQHRLDSIIDDGEGWVTLDEFVNNNPLIKRFMLEVEHQLVVQGTRRTVQVSMRKYRARKRRR
jgi:hypothetical protein